MKLELGWNDLKPEHRQLGLKEVSFDHFLEDVQKAIKIVGHGSFGSTSAYKNIYPPPTLRQFILNYLNQPNCAGVSVVDGEFHDAVAEQFPELKRTEKVWGCQPVRAAMRELRRLEKEMYVLRSRVSLGINWQPGFPRSVICYYVAKE